MVFAPQNKTLYCPSKIILWGEYGALVGGQAIVAAIEPYFELRTSTSTLTFSKNSLAQKYIDEQYPQNGVFFDPYQSQGGFGGSSAELALTLYHYGERAVWRAHTWLKKFDPRSSGIDLIAQWLGGIQEIDLTKQQTREVTKSWMNSEVVSNVFILQASHLPGRKTLTHQHLQSLKIEDLFKIKELQLKGFRDSSSKSWPELFNQYSELICSLGLESPETTRDREIFLNIPGVVGFKGCGARGSDVYLVLGSDTNPQLKEEVTQTAEDLGLRVHSYGLNPAKALGVHE